MAEVYTEKKIALRCTLCGKLEQHVLSIFSFSGCHSHRIHCSCGFRKAVINMKDRRNVHIQVPCILCETEHVFTYPAKQFWGAGLEGLICPESAAELGYFGDDETVQMAVEEWEKTHSGGFDEYFNNPAVMFDMLNHLHQVAENRRLFCNCGSREIEVDLYPDCLELHCSRCSAISRIPAVTTEDRDGLVAMETVVMHHGAVGSEENLGIPTLYRLK
jgi:hypothetical protein